MNVRLVYHLTNFRSKFGTKKKNSGNYTTIAHRNNLSTNQLMCYFMVYLAVMVQSSKIVSLDDHSYLQQFQERK